MFYFDARNDNARLAEGTAPGSIYNSQKRGILKMKTIITATVLVLSVSAYADMTANQVAAEVAAEVSKDLPQQLAGDMTLTAVESLGSRLMVKAQMAYDQAHTKQVMDKTG